MRLIDADALGDKFDQQMYYLRWEVDTEDNPHRFHRADGINWCRNTLNNAPTIDAEPVRHGYWKYRTIHEFNSHGELIKYCDIPYCSECGREYGTIRDIPYCNCGAIMDEEK